MNNFSFTAFVCLICTAALLNTAESQTADLRCKCLMNHIYSGRPIPRNRVLSVNVIPAGAHCKNVEIIVTMKRAPMCLDPAAEWVIKLINELTTTPQTGTLTTAKKLK